MQSHHGYAIGMPTDSGTWNAGLNVRDPLRVPRLVYWMNNLFGLLAIFVLVVGALRTVMRPSR